MEKSLVCNGSMENLTETKCKKSHETLCDQGTYVHAFIHRSKIDLKTDPTSNTHLITVLQDVKYKVNIHQININFMPVEEKFKTYQQPICYNNHYDYISQMAK